MTVDPYSATDAQLQEIGAWIRQQAERYPDSHEAEALAAHQATGRAIPRDKDIALFVRRHRPDLFADLLLE